MGRLIIVLKLMIMIWYVVSKENQILFLKKVMIQVSILIYRQDLDFLQEVLTISKMKK